LIPVVVVFGATASGKTALAEALFSSEPGKPPAPGTTGRLRGGAEIVSADSMQVYRGLDIGTAKPDPRLLGHLPHHLLDLADPREQFGAGAFVRLADAACADIRRRGKLPVVLGGTAFYLRNFMYGLPETPEADPEIRAVLQSRLLVEGAEALMAELGKADPESAARINLRDEYRIVRALEVWHATGRPLSSFKVPDTRREAYSFLVISLERSREELNRRIAARVDEMFAQGLEAEFASLLRAGYGKDDPGMQAIGYREFFLADPPGSDPKGARDAIVRDSRLYAKRQETFFKPLPDVLRLPAGDFAAAEKAILDFLGT